MRPRVEISEHGKHVFGMVGKWWRLQLSHLSMRYKPVVLSSALKSSTGSLESFRISSYTSSAGLVANLSRLAVRRPSRTRDRSRDQERSSWAIPWASHRTMGGTRFSGLIWIRGIFPTLRKRKIQIESLIVDYNRHNVESVLNRKSLGTRLCRNAFQRYRLELPREPIDDHEEILESVRVLQRAN